METLQISPEAFSPATAGIDSDSFAMQQIAETPKPISDQIRQAEKIEAIGTLASGIAHNFNNLLMGIQGNASLARMKLEDDHPVLKMLSNIDKMVESGAKLTRQLLNYAREKPEEIAPVNLNRIIRETCETFGVTRREIRIHLDLADNLKDVKAHQGQIEQVLLNLYVNAGDAMPQGGDLYLHSRNVDHCPQKDLDHALSDGPFVLLKVRDTGIGLDEATQKRIFEPFFTTKGFKEGTGLGLSSAYGIIQSHGGHIQVSSSPGQGADFSIYLPAAAPAATEAVKSDVALLKGQETILLVDDEALVLEVGAELLESLGYTVQRASGGLEALSLYEADPDQIDMVILDMILPDVDGGDTFDKLKAINPDLKVLLSSGYDLDGKAADIIGRGCDGFIQKPFKMQALSQKIRAILD
jgi:nitrogen-specific signal transduction histidine kinase